MLLLLLAIFHFLSYSSHGTIEAVVRRCSIKKVFLKISQISQEETCARDSFLIRLLQACNFIKKEALSQVFSCEICEIFKNTFFIEHLWWLLLLLHSEQDLHTVIKKKRIKSSLEVLPTIFT